MLIWFVQCFLLIRKMASARHSGASFTLNNSHLYHYYIWCRGRQSNLSQAKPAPALSDSQWSSPHGQAIQQRYRMCQLWPRYWCYLWILVLMDSTPSSSLRGIYKQYKQLVNKQNMATTRSTMTTSSQRPEKLSQHRQRRSKKETQWAALLNA